jgi:hypothetical protein
MNSSRADLIARNCPIHSSPNRPGQNPKSRHFPQKSPVIAHRQKPIRKRGDVAADCGFSWQAPLQQNQAQAQVKNAAAENVKVSCYRLLLLPVTDQSLESIMNDEVFTLSMRKFLKMVGVSSQTAIENAVAQAIADKSISGTESLPATMTLEIGGLKLKTTFNGSITLE